ncbi:MAG: DNA sulfur modification protein DndD [Solirubrobacterales bacterium]|nr:DNA sulfur modification protein DndD [Solirubrobacterales bacterium]
MIFESLELEDFGLYAGRQRLDLRTEPGRPIVLVGGTNGAGKTTLLEAFTLCLHGRRALGHRVSRERYDGHIGSRFHVRPNGEPAKACSVSLSFTHVHSARESEYVVTRRWRRTNKGRLQERLTIAVDGEDVDDFSDTSRQDFLDSLLPPGLAGFFLFDGEKIQALADDENGELLADAVKRLLGLDLIGQLQADLKRFAGGTAKGKRRALQERLAQAGAAHDAAQAKLAEVLDRRANLQSREDQIQARIARIRDRLAREGGALAAERAATEAAARKAAAETAAAGEELRGLVTGLLPFAIAQRIADSVEQRLDVEQAAEENEIIARRLKAAAPKLRRRLQSKTDDSVLETLRETFGVRSKAAPARLHDVTAAERAVMLDQLHLVRDAVRADAARLGKRLRAAQDQVDRAERKLAQVPDDEALAPVISDLQEAERLLGTLQADMNRVDDEHRQAEHELKVAARELQRAEDADEKVTKGVKSARLALRTIELLKEYGRRSEQQRLQQIELDAARYFNRLSRKGEMLSGIVIDRESFRIRVIRWDGTELPKERLSAGEKQLLAIAILWALSQASRRPLPVVVDTPLARLDAEHRRRLLTEYLPHVSHQVVVLSTDTEVDVAAAAQLDDVTARRISLTHDLETAATRIEQGYFSSAEEVQSDAR